MRIKGADTHMPDYTVQSVSRALDLLAILRTAPEGLPLLTLVERSGLPKGTVYRFMATLVKGRFVEQADGRYRVGLGAFLVGNAFLALDLRARALPHLVHLRDQSRWPFSRASRLST
jgi:IclR family acetate operon transcriptional repressor